MAETSDFAGARAALSTSMAVIGPMLQAMQDASKVFDVMANAQAHADVLSADVTRMHASQKKLTATLEKANDKLAAAENAALAAETAALKRIADAQITADANVAAVELAAIASVATIKQQVAAAQTKAAQEIAVVTEQALEARKAFETAQAERAEAVAVLEKKLNTLRASAARFAASLTVE